MTPDILLLIKACEGGLQIRKPVNIIIKTQVKGEIGKLAGYCDSYFRKGKISGHKVVIHLDTVFSSEYSINDVIAHELIHASMMENGLFNLTEDLNNLQFNIGTLYDPNIDDE